KYDRSLTQDYLTALNGHSSPGNTRKRGNGRSARSEHLVACLELGYVPAARFDLAGYVNAQPCVPWFAQPGHRAKRERASHEVPVNRIEGSRANFYQNFVVSGNGLFNLLTLENIRRTVIRIDNCFHVKFFFHAPRLYLAGRESRRPGS